MDYSQYLIPLTVLPPGDVMPLLTLIELESHLFNQTDTSFSQRPGFKTYRQLSQTSANMPYIGALLERLAELLPRTAFRGYEVNIIEPGASLKEHTDIAALPQYQHRAHEVTKFHKVNVGLQGEASYLFRRDRRQPMEEAASIKVGDVALFNNYVYHEVRNEGQEPRINMTLFYADPDWKIKFSIYNKLGIDTNGY